MLNKIQSLPDNNVTLPRFQNTSQVVKTLSGFQNTSKILKHFPDSKIPEFNLPKNSWSLTTSAVCSLITEHYHEVFVWDTIITASKYSL